MSRTTEDKSTSRAVGGAAREDPADPWYRDGPGCLRRVFHQGFPSSSLVIFRSRSSLTQGIGAIPIVGERGLQRQPRHIRDRARAVGARVRDSSCTCVPVRSNARTAITLRPKCAILFVGSYANLRELVSHTIEYSFKPYEAL